MPSSSGLQRALSFSSAFFSLASTVTLRPARPMSVCCTTLSVRKNAAAWGSYKPRRLSSDSAVSDVRVISERYRRIDWTWPPSSWLANCRGVMLSTIVRTGRSDASGASEATAKVAPAPPSKRAVNAMVSCLGWRCTRSAAKAKASCAAWISRYFKILAPLSGGDALRRYAPDCNVGATKIESLAPKGRRRGLAV